MSGGRGGERWAPRALFLLLLLLLAAPRAAYAEAPSTGSDDVGEDDYKTAPSGRRFRVRFDPVTRVWLGIAGAVGRGSDGAFAGAPEVTSGFSYRAMYRKGKGRDQIIWQIDHRVLAGYVRPFQREVEGLPSLDASLYSASMLRHDEAPSIVMPFSPPVSIPFPFDIGFETDIGRVVIPTYLPGATLGGAKTPMIHVGVLRAALLLDPWRTGKTGRSLEIGVGARYDIDTYAEPTLKTPKVVHRVAPMTAASLRFRIQSDDGLALLDCRADVIPHWTSESTWKLMALSSLHFERILVAINDQPISAVLEGGYRLAPATRQVETIHDFRVSLGLSFNLQVK